MSFKLSPDSVNWSFLINWSIVVSITFLIFSSVGSGKDFTVDSIISAIITIADSFV